MAKVKIQGNASGTGVFTITPPATSTDRTLTLPDATGTILMTDGDGSSLTGITHTPADNSVTLAKMAHGTDGELITYDAAGAPANVAVGTSGHILTSGGAGVAPTFQAAAGGGKLLQVIIGTYATHTTIATSSFTDIGLDATITPSATTSKILCMWTNNVQLHSNEGMSVRLMRDATAIYTDVSTSPIFYHTAEVRYRTGGWFVLDSPSTTSAITYTAEVASKSGNTIEFNNSGTQTQLLLMEIGA
jgi:hypothetical protein